MLLVELTFWFSFLRCCLEILSSFEDSPKEVRLFHQLLIKLNFWITIFIVGTNLGPPPERQLNLSGINAPRSGRRGGGK